MKKLIFLSFFFLCGCITSPIEFLSTVHEEFLEKKSWEKSMREILLDIGGKEIVISHKITGLYFHPKTFQKKEFSSYKKWKRLFSDQNSKLAEILKVNRQSKNFPSLFSISRTPFIKKKEEASIICFPSNKLPLEFEIKWILTYLLKGFPVLMINQKNFPITETAHWIHNHIAGSLIICGKGSGVSQAINLSHYIHATYLILEQVPQLSLLRSAPKNTTIIHSKWEKQIHLSSPFPVIYVNGDHYDSFLDHRASVWYQNEKDQRRIWEFLSSIFQ